jgi:hypothetical protein
VHARNRARAEDSAHTTTTPTEGIPVSTPDDPFARPDEPAQEPPGQGQPPTPPPPGQYPPAQPTPPTQPGPYPPAAGQQPPAPAYGAPPPQPAYGTPPPQPQYGAPQYPQQPPSRGTNALAIASLIIAILCFPPLGLILGIVALRQIKRTGEEGRGLALAGVWVGAIFTVIGAIVIAVAVGVAIWAVDKADDCEDGKYGPPLSQEWFANDCDDFVDTDTNGF